MFYGQFDTDRHIREFFPDLNTGICVDVGMGHPNGGSNTFHFERSGWQCLCVEPNEMYCQMAQGVRAHVEKFACGAEDVDGLDFKIFTLPDMNQSAISSLKPDDRLIVSHAQLIRGITTVKVNVRKLDTLLALHPWIDHIDFISIDTEDTELDVLKGFDIARWQPKLMVIENNHDEPFLADYLRPFGYGRVRRVGVNDFFVKQ